MQPTHLIIYPILVCFQVKIWFQNRRMKFKKVNSGYDGSPDGMMKAEDIYHSMSPEAILYRQHSDPCGGLADQAMKPLDMTSQKYPYYSVPSVSTAPITNSLVDNFANFTYQTPYYNPIPHSGQGLDLHSLSMPTPPPTHGAQAPHHQKYPITSNNNSMQYNSQYTHQYYTGQLQIRKNYSTFDEFSPCRTKCVQFLLSQMIYIFTDKYLFYCDDIIYENTLLLYCATQNILILLRWRISNRKFSKGFCCGEPADFPRVAQHQLTRHLTKDKYSF